MEVRHGREVISGGASAPGRKYRHWLDKVGSRPSSLEGVRGAIVEARGYREPGRLDYGDHGLTSVRDVVTRCIQANKRIALYADYDVDGTMSCVSWIWFLEAIGYSNFLHYIPCRFKEGYGLNMQAISHLVENEGAELIITMDTGITANDEAAYCKAKGVDFICTDHHKIQPEKMPDCLILNPKLHPDPEYQELCGAAVTFVLLRKLAQQFHVPSDVWTDILALTGMATICDVVPLNGVNHTLAKQGISSLMRSKRPVLRRLLEACQVVKGMDEKDVGFRLGPRINAVGRLEHADLVVQAFVSQDPELLIRHMDVCNERRKQIQLGIVKSAREKARAHGNDPILFLGGDDWHPGVVGIAASKIAEEFWRPTWLFQRKDGKCKGSARSIVGFDVTSAMGDVGSLFEKFGGHKAAGGYTFEVGYEEELRQQLNANAGKLREFAPELWESKISFDCALPCELLSLQLTDLLDDLKPFGHGFEEPRFCLSTRIVSAQHLYDKQTGEAKHTSLLVEGRSGQPQKVMFFNEALPLASLRGQAKMIVTAARNHFRGETSLALYGCDVDVS